MSDSRLTHVLVYAASGCFVAYIIGTAWVMIPAMADSSGAELFGLGKHLVVLLGVAVWLVLQPRLGSLAALAWGVIVPFGKYKQLAIEFADGSLQQSATFAPSDVVRLVLLLLGTCVAAAVAIALYKPAAPLKMDAK